MVTVKEYVAKGGVLPGAPGFAPERVIRTLPTEEKRAEAREQVRYIEAREKERARLRELKLKPEEEARRMKEFYAKRRIELQPLQETKRIEAQRAKFQKDISLQREIELQRARELQERKKGIFADEARVKRLEQEKEKLKARIKKDYPDVDVETAVAPTIPTVQVGLAEVPAFVGAPVGVPAMEPEAPPEEVPTGVAEEKVEMITAAPEEKETFLQKYVGLVKGEMVPLVGAEPAVKVTPEEKEVTPTPKILGVGPFPLGVGLGLAAIPTKGPKPGDTITKTIDGEEVEFQVTKEGDVFVKEFVEELEKEPEVTGTPIASVIREEDKIEKLKMAKVDKDAGRITEKEYLQRIADIRVTPTAEGFDLREQVKKLETDFGGETYLAEKQKEINKVQEDYDKGRLTFEEAEAQMNKLNDEIQSKQTEAIEKADEFKDEISRFNEKYQLEKEWIVHEGETISRDEWISKVFSPEEVKQDVERISELQLETDKLLIKGGFAEISQEDYIKQKKEDLITEGVNRYVAKYEAFDLPHTVLMKAGLDKVVKGTELTDIALKPLVGAGYIAYGVQQAYSGLGKYVLKPIGEVIKWKGLEEFGEFVERKPTYLMGATAAGLLGVAGTVGVGAALPAVVGTTKLATGAAGIANILGVTYATAKGTQLVGRKAQELVYGRKSVLSKEEYAGLYAAPDFEQALAEKLRAKGYEGKDFAEQYRIELMRRSAARMGEVAGYITMSGASEFLGRQLTKGVTAKALATKKFWGKGGYFAKYISPFGAVKQPIFWQIGTAGFGEGAAGAIVYRTTREQKVRPLEVLKYGALGTLSAGWAGGAIAGGLASRGAAKITGGGIAGLGYITDPYEWIGDKLVEVATMRAPVMGSTFTHTRDPTLTPEQTQLQKIKETYESGLLTPAEAENARSIYLRETGITLGPTDTISLSQARVAGTTQVMEPPAPVVERAPVTERAPVLVEERAPVSIAERELVMVPTKEMTQARIRELVTTRAQVPVTVRTQVPVTTRAQFPATVTTRAQVPAVTTPTQIQEFVTTRAQVPVQTQVGVPVYTFPGVGIPFGMLPFGARRFGFGRAMREWTVVNPLKDIATPYIMRKGATVGALMPKLKPMTPTPGGIGGRVGMAGMRRMLGAA